MENMNPAAAPAAVPQPAPAPQPQKVRRVGTFAFGLTLIAAGVLLLCAILIPGFDPRPILRLAPVILIALGIEVLVYAARPNVKLKYDFLSMLGCAFILVVMGGASLLPLLWDWAGPGRDARVQVLTAQLEERGTAALEKVPALKDCVYTADYYLRDSTFGLSGEQAADLDAAIAAGACSANANFVLRPGYADAEAFAADCAQVLAACKALPLDHCYFTTWQPEYGSDAAAEPYQVFSLNVSGRWEQQADAGRLAAQVDADWRYRDLTFPTREDLDRYLAETETGQTEAEFQQQLYQQGYDEGYAAALAEAGAPPAVPDAQDAPAAQTAPAPEGEPAPGTDAAQAAPAP